MDANPNTTNPNSLSIGPHYYYTSASSSSSSYSYYYPSSSASSCFYLQNPNSQSSLQPLYLPVFYTEPTTTTTAAAAAAAAPATSSTTATILRPPDVAESYASLSSYPPGPAAELSAYYLDPNAQNWALKEAVRQYGSDPSAVGGAVAISVPPNGTEQLAIAHPGSSVWANLTFRPQGNGTWKKHQKKTKVVQSAYCEVCKVDCNSKDVLDQHKLGKKHKKNLEKLQAVAAAGSSVSVSSNNPIIGPQENPDKGKAVSKPNSRKAAQPPEDLETKKRKVLEGGAAAEAVRTCVICNVVCNSETVFSHHLAGQKHAAMLKKHATTTRVATITRL